MIRLTVALSFAILFLLESSSFSVTPECPEKESFQQKKHFSLTISGGISLGAYEAGFNWALVELMKRKRDKYQLDVITGASAGNINTILSAILWCKNYNVDNEKNSIFNNLFWNTWIPVGLDVLFPGDISASEYNEIIMNSFPGNDNTSTSMMNNASSYQEGDGIFTRRAFNYTDQAIRKEIGLETFAELSKLPDKLTFPENLDNKIRYDNSREFLIFKGVMSEKEKMALLNISKDDLFNKAIESLFQRSQPRDFIDDCSVAIGITATRAKHASIFLESDKTKSQRALHTQKFVLPLAISSDSSKSQSKTGRLRIETLTIDSKKSKKTKNDFSDPNGQIEDIYQISNSGVILELPTQKKDNGNEIIESVATDTIIDVVKASSAFPLAFSPMTIPHCIETNQAQNKNNANSEIYSCDKNDENNKNDKKQLRYDQFIDGGALDNIPLGLAVELYDAQYKKDEKKADGAPDATYLYIEPNQTRHNADFPKDIAELLDSYRGIEKFWYPFADEYLHSVLDTELVKARNQYFDSKKNLVISDRFAPITGSYLFHFGAFLDRPLREYDYYVGVYDGLVNIAKYMCMEEMEEQKDGNKKECYDKCIGKKMKDYIAHFGLFKDGKSGESQIDDAGYVIREIASREFATATFKLENQPTALIFPDKVKDKIRYDSLSKHLVFKGVMSDEEKSVLLDFFNGDLYREAIKSLFQKSQNPNFSWLSELPNEPNDLKIKIISDVLWKRNYIWREIGSSVNAIADAQKWEQKRICSDRLFRRHKELQEEVGKFLFFDLSKKEHRKDAGEELEKNQIQSLSREKKRIERNLDGIEKFLQKNGENSVDMEYFEKTLDEIIKVEKKYYAHLKSIETIYAEIIKRYKYSYVSTGEWDLPQALRDELNSLRKEKGNTSNEYNITNKDIRSPIGVSMEILNLIIDESSELKNISQYKSEKADEDAYSLNNTFENFISELGKRGYANANIKNNAPRKIERYMSMALRDYNNWQEKSMIQAVERLGDIESADSSLSTEKIVDFTQFMLINKSKTIRVSPPEGDNPFSFIELDPSSVPDKFEELEFYAHLIPSRIGFNFTEGGLFFGYQPLLKLGDYISVRFPIEPYNRNTYRHKNNFSYGLALSVDLPGNNLPSSIAFGAIRSHDWDGFDVNIAHGYRASLGFLGDKFSVSWNFRDNSRWDSTYWALSIDDFNGLLYWAMSIFRHHENRGRP